MGVEVVFDVLQQGSYEVRDASGKLREERQAVTTAFLKVVGGDWTGSAADSFRGVYEQWNTGLEQVEQGLADMGQLIDDTKRDFSDTEGGVTDGVSAIAARLDGRLG